MTAFASGRPAEISFSRSAKEANLCPFREVKVRASMLDLRRVRGSRRTSIRRPSQDHRTANAASGAALVGKWGACRNNQNIRRAERIQRAARNVMVGRRFNFNSSDSEKSGLPVGSWRGQRRLEKRSRIEGVPDPRLGRNVVKSEPLPSLWQIEPTQKGYLSTRVDNLSRPLHSGGKHAKC
jgi:hypothetical protein